MNASRHILVVDDDAELCELLTAVLTKNEFRVSVALNGTEMSKILRNGQVDLVILDIGMPGEDGLSLCRRLRVNGPIPIIMLTARSGEIDRIVGLEMGADDYLSKPFSVNELLARIRALLRRSAMPPWVAAASVDGGLSPRQNASATQGFAFEGWHLDAVRRQLRSPMNVLVDLRTAEYELLLAFVEHPQRILTRDELLDLARGPTADVLDRSIDVHISRLRNRLEVDPKQPELIKTIRGEGYIFTASVRSIRSSW